MMQRILALTLLCLYHVALIGAEKQKRHRPSRQWSEADLGRMRKMLGDGTVELFNKNKTLDDAQRQAQEISGATPRDVQVQLQNSARGAADVRQSPQQAWAEKPAQSPKKECRCACWPRKNVVNK